MKNFDLLNQKFNVTLKFENILTLINQNLDEF